MMCKYKIESGNYLFKSHHHTLRPNIDYCIHENNRSFTNYIHILNQKQRVSSGKKTKNRAGREVEEMVGERQRREPEKEANKWHRRSKVWSILRKGEVTTFIEYLHGWKPSITKLMVKIWNEGQVKIDGVDFMVTEEVILL